MSLGGPIVKDKLWFFAGAEFGRFLAFGPFEDSTLPNQKEIDLGQLRPQVHRPACSESPPQPDRRATTNTWVPLRATSTPNRPAGARPGPTTKMLGLDYSAILGPNTVLEARVGAMRITEEWRSQNPSGEPTFVDYTVYPNLYYGGPVLDLGLGSILRRRRGHPDPARRQLHQGRPRVPFRGSILPGRWLRSRPSSLISTTSMSTSTTPVTRTSTSTCTPGCPTLRR